jgi:hypothetical protein
MLLLEIGLLGPPLIRCQNRELSLAARKSAALLYYLAAHPGRPLNRSQLAALLWEEHSEAEGRNNLSTALSRLRHSLQATITGLRGAVKPLLGPEDSPGVPADVLATVLSPDIVTIDFSKPVAFPNGRRLTDDVVTAALGLVLNHGNVLGGGPGISDGVPANDSAFLSTFPYEAAPHQPQ